MPVHRRSSRRRALGSGAFKRAVNEYWVPVAILGNMAVSHAAPNSTDLGLQTNLTAMYGEHLKGATLMRVVGDLFCSPNVAPGVGTADIITLGFIVEDKELTPAQLNPADTGATAGAQRQWLWTKQFMQQYVAAPVAAAQQVLTGPIPVDIKTKRLFHSNNQVLFLAGGTWVVAATQVFEVGFAGRALIRIP